MHLRIAARSPRSHADRRAATAAYLFAVLDGTAVWSEIDLARWKPIAGFMQRMRERPHVERAFTEELELYLREVAPPPEAGAARTSKHTDAG